MAVVFKRWATAQKGHFEQGALGAGVVAAVFGVWMLVTRLGCLRKHTGNCVLNICVSSFLPPPGEGFESEIHIPHKLIRLSTWFQLVGLVGMAVEPAGGGVSLEV